MNAWKEELAEKQVSFEKEETTFQQYEQKHLQIVQAAVSAYQRFEESDGKAKTGNILLGESRSRAERKVNETKDGLLSKQVTYNAHYPDRTIVVDTEDCSAFKKRRDLIWMDDLQSIKEKLSAQTKRYKSIFKTEFVLNIYTYCKNAKESLHELNGKLARLDFTTTYKFDGSLSEPFIIKKINHL